MRGKVALLILVLGGLTFGSPALDQTAFGIAGLGSGVRAATVGVTQLGSEISQYSLSSTLSSFAVPAGTDRVLVVIASDTNATSVTGVSFGTTALTISGSR